MIRSTVPPSLRPALRIGLAPVVAAAVILAAALAPAGPGLAQDSQAGVVLSRPVTVTVNAMPLGASVDLGQPIALRLMDDSPENLAMVEEVRTSLIAQGHTLVPEDRARLLLEVDTAASSAPRRPDPDSGALGVSGEAGTGQDEDSVAVRLRLFSNTQVSVLGGDRDAPSPPLGGPGLRLDAGLTDRETGRRVWQGWATITAPGVDTATAARMLAGPLMADLGKPARLKTVTHPAGPLTLP